jgi:hypothetical protein
VSCQGHPRGSFKTALGAGIVPLSGVGDHVDVDVGFRRSTVTAVTRSPL